MSERGTIGVVIVTFNSAPVIAECLESVFASKDADLAVVVVDNDSTDSTLQVIEEWASGRMQRRRDDMRNLQAPAGRGMETRAQSAGDSAS